MYLHRTFLSVHPGVEIFDTPLILPASERLETLNISTIAFLVVHVATVPAFGAMNPVGHAPESVDSISNYRYMAEGKKLLTQHRSRGYPLERELHSSVGKSQDDDTRVHPIFFSRLDQHFLPEDLRRFCKPASEHRPSNRAYREGQGHFHRHRVLHLRRL